MGDPRRTMRSASSREYTSKARSPLPFDSRTVGTRYDADMDDMAVSSRYSGNHSVAGDCTRNPAVAKVEGAAAWITCSWRWPTDRKSTRLNSSHSQISYAV